MTEWEEYQQISSAESKPKTEWEQYQQMVKQPPIPDIQLQQQAPASPPAVSTAVDIPPRTPVPQMQIPAGTFRKPSMQGANTLTELLQQVLRPQPAVSTSVAPPPAPPQPATLGQGRWNEPQYQRGTPTPTTKEVMGQVLQGATPLEKLVEMWKELKTPGSSEMMERMRDPELRKNAPLLAKLLLGTVSTGHGLAAFPSQAVQHPVQTVKEIPEFMAGPLKVLLKSLDPEGRKEISDMPVETVAEVLLPLLALKGGITAPKKIGGKITEGRQLVKRLKSKDPIDIFTSKMGRKNFLTGKTLGGKVRAAKESTAEAMPKPDVGVVPTPSTKITTRPTKPVPETGMGKRVIPPVKGLRAKSIKGRGITPKKQFGNETDFVGKDLHTKTKRTKPFTFVDKSKQIIPKKGKIIPEKGKIPPALPQETTKLSKVETAKLRKDYGLEKLDPVVKKSFEEPYIRAKETGADVNAVEIAKEVIDSRRATSDVEHVGAVVKAAEIKNEVDIATTAIRRAEKSGNIDAIAKAESRRQAFLDQLETITRGSDIGGTEGGRGMGIRRIPIAGEDLSIAHSLVEAKILKGKPLKPKESGQIERAVKRYDRLKKRHEELQIKYTEEIINREGLIAERVAAYYSRKSAISRLAAGEKRAIQTQRANIKKEIAALGFRVNDITGVPPEVSYLTGRLALNYVREGVTNVKRVAKKVMADLPDLQEADVYRAINAKDPKRQARAKTEAQANIHRIKREAKILDDIQIGRGDLKAGLMEIQDLSYHTAPDGLRLEKTFRKINEIRDKIETGVSSGEEIRDLRRLMDTEKKLLDINKQLQTGEFVVKQKPAMRWMPKELERAKVELHVARKHVRATIDANKPTTRGRVTMEVINTMRTVRATADMSGTFRQGFVAICYNPKAGAVNFGKAVEATFSKYGAERYDNWMRSRDTYYIGEKAKLHISSIEGRLGPKEEMFMSNVIEKVPVIGGIVKASNRHMTTFLNLMRTSMFDDFLLKYPNATSMELAAWADWINVCTGRGKMDHKLANALSTVVFAPRFAWSRVMTPYMLGKYLVHPKTLPRVRKEVLRNGWRLTKTVVAALGLAHLAGFKVGTDPREADWCKIRVGNTRYDILSGMQQPTRVFARLLLAFTTDAAGITGKHLTEETRKIKPLDLIYRFSSYKLGPIVTTPIEFYMGKTVVGEKMTKTQTALRMITTMCIEDIIDAYKEEDGKQTIPVGVATFMGVGASTYEDSESKTRRDYVKLKQKGKHLEAGKLIRDWNAKHSKNRIESVKMP